jgi:hypothetical protein
MPRIKLNKAAIDALPTPKSDVVYWDAAFPGFCHRTDRWVKFPGFSVGRWESPGPAGAFMRLVSEMWLR